jgi:glycosyltransferase involved in cell wall biosynthesis
MSRQPLHIALISEEYPPLTGWGGIGTYTYNLARGLAAAGHRVEVVAGAAQAAAVHSEGGLTLHRIGFAAPASPAKRGVYRIFQVATRRLPELRRRLEFAHAAAGLLRRIHREDPLQICETAEYGGNGYFLARAGLLPMVVKIHTPTLFNYRLNELPVSREVRWCDRFERRQTRLASLRTAPSRKMANLAVPWLGDGRPIEVLPNPIDTEEFQPGGTAADAGCDYLFYTGRLERRKGVHLLLQAFREVHRRHPALRLVLAGHDTPTFRRDGQTLPFREYARSTGLLEGMGEAVMFLGRVDRSELPPWYQGSLACVFPSEGFENFPYSCLEAMACGKAAVVTDAGGMAEMAEDGVSGFCVRAGEAAPLAEALDRLASDRALAQRMGVAARRRVMAEYSLPSITAQTLRRYEEVLADARR